MSKVVAYGILVVVSIAFAMEDFPISAFHVDSTQWFQGAGEDSLGLNLIWLGGPERYDSVKLVLVQRESDKTGVGFKVENWL